MKKAMIFITALVFSSMGFAKGGVLTGFTCSFNKNSPQLKALGSAWQSKQVAPQSQDQGDINMVYGGKDVSPRQFTDIPFVA